jgi:antitoxin VapB
MTKQLNIRSDEAHRLAHLIPERLDKPVVDVVLQALREFGSKLPSLDDLTPTQRAEYEAFRELARKAAKHKLPGATLDHSDLYDEYGLSR